MMSNKMFVFISLVISSAVFYQARLCVADTATAHWADWSSWTSCNATCDGTSYRVRFCVDSRENAQPISTCGHSATSMGAVYPYDVESRLCSSPCAVSGNWSEWSTWSKCSVTCGIGISFRARHCLSGSNCAGDIFDQKSCFEISCPIDGGWSNFTDLPCSATCGIGVLVSRRTCDNPPPQFGGADCVGSATKFAKCDAGSCVRDGAWGAWSEPTTCDVVCGDGYVRRMRNCDNPPPSAGGAPCPGEAVDKTLCHNKDCPSDIKTCRSDIAVTVNVTDICDADNMTSSADDQIIELYCAVPTDKTKWRLGIQILDNCEMIPLHVPIGEVDIQTSDVIEYGVMTDCYMNSLSIAKKTCQDEVAIKTYSLASTKNAFHMILF